MSRGSGVSIAIGCAVIALAAVAVHRYASYDPLSHARSRGLTPADPVTSEHLAGRSTTSTHGESSRELFQPPDQASLQLAQLSLEHSAHSTRSGLYGGGGSEEGAGAADAAAGSSADAWMGETAAPEAESALEERDVSSTPELDTEPEAQRSAEPSLGEQERSAAAWPAFPTASTWPARTSPVCCSARARATSSPPSRLPCRTTSTSTSWSARAC